MFLHNFIIRIIPVIAEVFIITVAHSSVTSWRLGFLHCTHHARAEGWSHQSFLPPVGRLVLRNTIIDDSVEDGLVGADPVVNIAPPLPLMLGLELDS